MRRPLSPKLTKLKIFTQTLMAGIGLMKVNKSSRHPKITGDFAERLVLYWLSKYGFECSYVDHTGIDIIARNPHTNELVGISVKGRSRSTGTEETDVTIPKKNFGKAEVACKAFGCIPYFAIVVDAADKIYVFILSMKHLLKICPVTKSSAGWHMRKKHIAAYLKDPSIMVVNFKHQTIKWWGS